MNCKKCTITSIFTINGFCLTCFNAKLEELKDMLKDAPTDQEMRNVLKNEF